MNTATEKRNYVMDLSKALGPLQDFEAIAYAQTATGAEYIRISDCLGGCAFLDVTGRSLEDILCDVAKIVLRQVPASVIRDIEHKRKIAPLFRGKGGRKCLED